MLKQQKGITLVALVITIIVLLILAGVTISLTLKEGGIFGRAQTAATNWKNAEQKETYEMDQFENTTDKVLYNTTGFTTTAE